MPTRGRFPLRRHAGLRWASLALSSLLAFAAHPALADAGGAPLDSLNLSLTEAVERARARAPDVMSAHVARSEADALRIGAGLILPANPRLSVDLRPPLDQGQLSHTGYGAMLEFLFDVGGAPAARIREADHRVRLAAADVEVQESRAREAAWNAYVRASVGMRRIAQIRDVAQIAERVVAAAARRSALGATGDIDKSLAQSELAQVQLLLSDATRQYERRAMDLRQLLDLPAQLALSLTTAVEMPEPAPRAGELAARALRLRPELKAIGGQIELLRAIDERLGRETLPRVGSYVGIDAAPLSPIFGVAGLSIELPVAQRNAGSRAAARVRLAGLIQRLEFEERSIVREVLSGYEAYEMRRAELKALDENALPAAEKTLELVEEGWRSGEFDVFRVTSAARDVARLRGMRLDAIEAAWVERAALDRIVGGLPTHE
jgi:cobalt-zinc-cadmium efflux system outer membrane protein